MFREVVEPIFQPVEEEEGHGHGVDDHEHGAHFARAPGVLPIPRARAAATAARPGEARDEGGERAADGRADAAQHAAEAQRVARARRGGRAGGGGDHAVLLLLWAHSCLRRWRRAALSEPAVLVRGRVMVILRPSLCRAAAHSARRLIFVGMLLASVLPPLAKNRTSSTMRREA